MPTLSNDVDVIDGDSLNHIDDGNDVNVVNVGAKTSKVGVVKRAAFENGHFYESVGGVFYSVERDDGKMDPVPDFDHPAKKGRASLL